MEQHHEPQYIKTPLRPSFGWRRGFKEQHPEKSPVFWKIGHFMGSCLLRHPEATFDAKVLYNDPPNGKKEAYQIVLICLVGGEPVRDHNIALYPNEIGCTDPQECYDKLLKSIVPEVRTFIEEDVRKEREYLASNPI